MDAWISTVGKDILSNVKVNKMNVLLFYSSSVIKDKIPLEWSSFGRRKVPSSSRFYRSLRKIDNCFSQVRSLVKFHKRVSLPLKSHVHVYKWWAGLLCVYLKNDTQLKIRQFYSSKKKMCYLRFHRIANGTNNYPPLPHCVSSLAWIFNIPIPVLRISRLGTLWFITQRPYTL